ncbi:MAG: hypothetical protein A2Y86_05865 [Candidatus Aminicenantes bacterium RBG_13_62_12]|nr:MAG: hypothetical protein A2Y86_05865 [Candidatus Aminicenantes bacterium RBG_13_62_12]
MNKKMDDRDFEEIGRLIQNEVDEALRVFRSKDLGERLRARIAADERAVKAKSFLRKISVPAAVATLLTVSVALFLLNVHRPPAPNHVHPRLFAAVLRQLPSFSRPAAESPSSPAGEVGMSGAGGGFQSALASAERRKEEEERETPLRADGPRVPVLSLKKKMEILYKDKVIERALVLLIGKSKEA